MGEPSSSMQALSSDQKLPGEEASEKIDKKYLDGTGRYPKPNQIKILDWLYSNSETYVRAVVAPTGAGKSYIAKTISYPGSVIIVSDNTQLDQYRESYPDLNYLTGKEHYKSDDEYEEAVERLLTREITVTNMHAWVAFNRFCRDDRRQRPSQIIIDEFHRLEDSVISMSSGIFTRRRYPKLPLTNNIHSLINFFQDEITSLENKIKSPTNGKTLNIEQITDAKKEIMQMSAALQGLKDEAGEYVIDVQRTPPRVSVTRLQASSRILRFFINSPKIVLLSATPRPSDLRIFGSGVKEMHPSADIPYKQRQIQYLSVPFKMNRYTRITDIKPYIDKILARHKGQNGVIHLTYSRAKELRELYPQFIYHTNSPKDKRNKLKQFKEKGGILVASGCAEGVDLPGDMCRFQIIPWMLKPNLGDLWVKARLAKIDGRSWYDWNTILTFAQMAGRSTRNPNDWSSVYTFDATIGKLHCTYRKELWQWFKDALVLYSRM